MNSPTVDMSVWAEPTEKERIRQFNRWAKVAARHTKPFHPRRKCIDKSKCPFHTRSKHR